MRVLISAHMSGGIGGAQRGLTSWLNALAEHEVTLFTRRSVDSGFVVEFPHVERVVSWRFFGRGGRIGRRLWPPLRRVTMPNQRFDLYIHFFAGEYLGDCCRATLKILQPSGNPTGEIEHLFDYVISQSPDGLRLVSDPAKHRVVPPPTYWMADKAHPVEDLPEDFLLTVFNPYSADLKGDDILYDVMERSSRPLVWCHSSVSNGSTSNLVDLPNLIHMENVTQAQLRFLYQRCSAYVSFSRSEGYGWAVADAILSQKPVISRRVGVVSFFGETPGLMDYDSAEELVEHMNTSEFPEATYETDVFSAQAAVAALESLVLDEAQVRPRRG